MREYLGHGAALEPGERVICLRNSRDFQVFNGLQGVVTDAYRVDRRPHLDLETATERFARLPYDPGQFGREKSAEHRRGGPCLFDYAYVITCHKAQGDEFDRVLVIEEPSDLWEPSRWNYTAASRARESLTWASPDRGRRPAETVVVAAAGV